MNNSSHITGQLFHAILQHRMRVYSLFPSSEHHTAGPMWYKKATSIMRYGSGLLSLRLSLLFCGQNH